MKHYIINENMLCYHEHPSHNWMGILASKITKGATYTPNDGWFPLPVNPDRIQKREATRKDFDDFRVSTKGHLD